MKKLSLVPLMVMLFLEIPLAHAQNQNPGEKEEGAVSARFASFTKEASVVCGEFLPNQITGTTEMMALCGGRFGLKVSDKTFVEPQLIAGNGHAQRYLIGSLNFRSDLQIDDFVASAYAGADIHYATAPVYSGASAIGEQTSIYFGAHLGAALWWDISDNLYFRTDMQFLLNPGTALFVGASLVLRFAGGAGNEGAPQGQ